MDSAALWYFSERYSYSLIKSHQLPSIYTHAGNLDHFKPSRSFFFFFPDWQRNLIHIKSITGFGQKIFWQIYMRVIGVQRKCETKWIWWAEVYSNTLTSSVSFAIRLEWTNELQGRDAIFALIIPAHNMHISTPPRKCERFLESIHHEIESKMQIICHELFRANRTLHVKNSTMSVHRPAQKVFCSIFNGRKKKWTHCTLLHQLLGYNINSMTILLEVSRTAMFSISIKTFFLWTNNKIRGFNGDEEQEFIEPSMTWPVTVQRSLGNQYFQRTEWLLDGVQHSSGV